VLEAVVKVDIEGRVIRRRNRVTERSEDMLMGREMLQYPMCADEFLEGRGVK
jgi:hypothetical protein